MAGDRGSVAGLFSAITAAASKPVNDLVAKVGEKEGAKTPTQPRLSPAAALKQLALDDELEKAFQRALKRLGFELKVVDVLDPSSNSRKVSAAELGPKKFYILSILKDVLEKPGEFDENFGPFLTLQYLFAKNSLFFIISRDLSSMHASFQTFLDDWFDVKKIRGVFIIWDEVDKFLAESDPDIQVQRVQKMFKLDKFFGEVKPQASGGAATSLTPAEVAYVVKIMSQQAGDPFLEKPQDYFNDLVASADLPQAATFKGRWTGTPDSDAKLLLRVAAKQKYPSEHSRANQDTLGWVLKEILNKDPLASEESQAIIKIILDHNLINDPEALQELQAKAASIEAPSV